MGVILCLSEAKLPGHPDEMPVAPHQGLTLWLWKISRTKPFYQSMKIRWLSQIKISTTARGWMSKQEDLFKLFTLPIICIRIRSLIEGGKTKQNKTKQNKTK